MFGEVRPTISVIIPVKNAAPYLRRTLPAVLTAARRYGSDRIEVVIVDNRSTDESSDIVIELGGADVRLISSSATNVGTVRNFGAGRSRGGILSFLDADCLVEPDYFEKIGWVLATGNREVTGSRYALPPDTEWLERAWDGLHRSVRDGPVAYINSGNLIIDRSAFDQVGGFDETLTSGEDAELCARLRFAGYEVFESHLIRAYHLGNPKTLRAFFRRQLWHGKGAFGTARLSAWDKPLMLTLLHGACVISAGLVIVLGRGPTSFLAALVVSMTAPVMAVAYRCVQVRSVEHMPAGLLLYFLYFSARLLALASAVVDRLVVLTTSRRPVLPQ